MIERLCMYVPHVRQLQERTSLFLPVFFTNRIIFLPSWLLRLLIAPGGNKTSAVYDETLKWERKTSKKVVGRSRHGQLRHGLKRDIFWVIWLPSDFHNACRSFGSIWGNFKSRFCPDFARNAIREEENNDKQRRWRRNESNFTWAIPIFQMFMRWN